MKLPSSLALLALLAATGLAAEPPKEDPPAPEAKRSRVRAECAPELGLVKQDLSVKAYVRSARKFCSGSSPWAEKHLRVREVVGFVAPWSDHGYRAAKYFGAKLTSVSPLWFRVLPSRDEAASAKGAFEIAGQELAEEQDRWVKQVSGKAQVLPHFSLEGFEKMKALRALLEAPEELAREVADICERRRYAGAVFDVRLALFPGLRQLVPGLAKALGDALRGKGLRLVLSVPTMSPEASRGPDFDRSDADAVAAHVDAVVVGTRDFSRGAHGPAAPLPWVRASVARLLADAGGGGLRAEQLLIEVPLYGRAFQEGAAEGRVILANEVVKVLGRQKPELRWDPEAAEHSASLTASRVQLSLPSLASVEARLQLARSLGVGVALRELGSGFDSAFDLLPARSESAHGGAAVDGEEVPELAADETAADEELAAVSSEL